MPTVHWHVQITIESSTKLAFLKICEGERRSAANMMRVLIEQELERHKND